MKKIVYLLGGTVCLFVLYLATLFFMQDKLLFKPDNNYISPQKANLNDVSENMLTMSDNTKVMTWMKDGDKNTLVDATKQKDYILAYNRQGKESGSVDLNYIHALSAVKFNAGKTLAGEILNITITNVYAGGKLTFSPNGTSKISWELDNERYTLNQDFSQKIDEDLSGDSSQAITKDIDNTVFMLIPQPLTDKTLSIEFRRKGETEAKIYTVNMPGGSWETGKSYTYTLTLMDGLGIKIETEETPTDNKVIDGIKIEADIHREGANIADTVIITVSMLLTGRRSA